MIGAAALLSIATGTVLIVCGCRGKRVGDLPVCGSCGFDVAGIATSTTSKCPECGAALGSNVKLGRKQKRAWMIVCGTVLVLVPSAFVSLLVIRGMG